MKGNFFQGILFFWQGILLIFSPGLRRYIFWPIIVNLILFITIFSGLAWYSFSLFNLWIIDFPRWIVWLLGWLFWILFGALSLLIATFTFTLCTNLVASPFYGILAEKVQKNVEGTIATAPFSIPRILKRETVKILYFVPWLILFLILFLIPPLWPVMPFIIFFPLASFIAMQYIDYCPDNNGIPIKTVRARLKEWSFTMLGFGSVVSVAMSIPGANLFVPPAAVAGGCLLWAHLQKNGKKEPKDTSPIISEGNKIKHSIK